MAALELRAGRCGRGWCGGGRSAGGATRAARAEVLSEARTGASQAQLLDQRRPPAATTVLQAPFRLQSASLWQKNEDACGAMAPSSSSARERRPMLVRSRRNVNAIVFSRAIDPSKIDL